MSRQLALITALLVIGGRAHGQAFPVEDKEWAPLACGNPFVPMTDPYRDTKNAQHERDLVGDVSAPAGFSASDATFLYLRLRLDRNPAPDGKLKPYAWGVAISTDADAQTYEILAVVNGKTEEVALYKNSTTTRPNDPADPADTPPAQSYPFATHGLAEVTGSSGYGGDDDYYIALAIPWSALKPLGLSPATSVVAWAGSSDTPSALDGDLACHDGDATAPSLSLAASDPIVIDPNQDSDSDSHPDRIEIWMGTDPASKDSIPEGVPDYGIDLEGGGGCSTMPQNGSPWLLLLPLLLLALFRRRAP